MERKDARWLLGAGLLVLGTLGLLGNFGLLQTLSTLVWSVLFALLGLGFLAWSTKSRSSWWALIPGASLVGLGLTTFIGGDWGATVFLASIGLGFLAVYATDRSRWWAIIPAGTLLSLALVTQVGALGGTVLFLGLAVTFAAVWLESQRWAIYPALACMGVAVLTTNIFMGVWSFVWPLTLIGVGLYWLWTHQGRGQKH